MTRCIAGNIDDLVLSRPFYAHDPEELRCLVTLSLPYAGASQPGSVLGVVLAWEEQPSSLMAMQSGQGGTDTGKDDTRPGWTFLELQTLDQAPDEVTVSSAGQSKRVWFESVQEAEAASDAAPTTAAAASAGPSPTGLAGSRGQETTRPTPLNITNSHYTFDQTGHDDEEEGYRDPAFGGRPATTTNHKASVADMAEGEGTTPGAYGSPNDFWANWSDDEGAASDASASRRGYGTGSATRTPASRAGEEADEAYWASYGGVDSVVGDDRDEDERPPPRAHEREATARPAPSGAAGGGGEPPKTRTRRSSTVTPFKAAGQPPLEFLTEANVHAASSMAAAAAAAAAARPAMPRSQSHASGFAYPLDVGALSERLTRAQSRGADSDDETDVDLRVALEGIWRMYVGRGLTDAEELEEKRERFRRVVAGVLAAEV